MADYKIRNLFLLTAVKDAEVVLTFELTGADSHFPKIQAIPKKIMHDNSINVMISLNRAIVSFDHTSVFSFTRK